MNYEVNEQLIKDYVYIDHNAIFTCFTWGVNLNTTGKKYDYK